MKIKIVLLVALLPSCSNDSNEANRINFLERLSECSAIASIAWNQDNTEALNYPETYKQLYILFEDDLCPEYFYDLEENPRFDYKPNEEIFLITKKVYKYRDDANYKFGINKSFEVIRTKKGTSNWKPCYP